MTYFKPAHLSKFALFAAALFTLTACDALMRPGDGPSACLKAAKPLAEYSGYELYIPDGSEPITLASLNGKYGYARADGTLIVPPVYDFATAYFEDRAKVACRNYAGLIDSKGNEILPLRYDDVDSFSEGLAAVKLRDDYGYVDRDGQIVIAPQFELATAFSEGLARVWVGDKTGFIDKTGAIVIPATFDGAGDFSSGLAAAYIGGKLGFIDVTGEMVIPPAYDQTIGGFKGEYAIVYNSLPHRPECADEEADCLTYRVLQGVIDRKGDVIVPLFYDHTRFLEDHNVFAVAKAELVGAYTRQGEMVVSLREGDWDDVEAALAAALVPAAE